MARVKAEYFNAKAKGTGETQEVLFIPPAPSDGDLGGISEEKLAQITTNKEKISELKEDIVDFKKDAYMSKSVIDYVNLINADGSFSKFISEIKYNVDIEFAKGGAKQSAFVFVLDDKTIKNRKIVIKNRGTTKIEYTLLRSANYYGWAQMMAQLQLLKKL